jgi:hypothetical protein
MTAAATQEPWLKPNCENCKGDLPVDSDQAYVCSYMCTFCRDCSKPWDFVCPNCSGELLRRPRRIAK